MKRLVALFLLLPLAGQAQAGAWTQQQGHGQVIVTSTFTKADQLFDANGKLIAIDDYKKFELSAYMEYGLTDSLTLLGQTTYNSIDIKPPTDSEYNGFDYTEFGARARVWQGQNGVFSLQSTLRVPGASDEGNTAEAGNTQVEWDLRALAGYSFNLGSWASFAEAQAAYRFRFDDPPDEMRLDLTLGTRPHPKLLLLAQSFNTWTNGAGTGGFPRSREHKLQLSAVWDVRPNWSLQFGGLITADGVNTLYEKALFAGVWYRF